MSSVPNSYIDDLRSIVLATLNRIEQLRMRVLFGVDIVKGSYGQELQFKSDGKVYIDDVEIGTGGVTDHGALTGLADDDHTQYMPVSASRNFTGDVTIHKANPNLILYPTTTDSPRLQLKDNSNNLKSSIYQNTDDMAVVCEDGILYLATQVTTGGNIKLESKAVTQLEISNTVIAASVPLAMGANKISGLATPSANGDAVRYEHLAADDHTQYLLADGSRALTGDLTFNKLAPSIIFDTGDLLDYDKTSNAFDFSIGGSSKLYLSATDLIAKTNIAFLKTDPVLQFDSYDHFKYISASNALQLFIASTIEYEFTASTLDLKNNSLNNANIPGTDSLSFIIDQDNAGAGVSSSLRFNRGSTDGDAAIWWDEGDDEFQFESDVGVTVGSILIDECRHGGSVKTSRNPSTGDYEIEVATGDSIVFKAV